MMKKVLFLVGLAISSVVMTGCGSSSSTPPPPPREMDILYLDDGAGGLEGVPYVCSSGSGITDIDGAFAFYAGDNCTFDLNGYDGTVFLFDPLFIDYNDGSGVSDIGYDCASGTNGFTDIDGSFDYDIDDECTFYL
jgi:hypothetical protein